MSTPLTPSQWYNLDFLTIQPNPQYVPDPDNPGERIIQLGWIEITTAEQLADVQQQIAGLTPVPPPEPNCNEWRFQTRGNFSAVFSTVQAVDLFSATTLVNLIMGLPGGDVPNMITLWNEAMSAIDVVPLAADFVAIEAAAVTHNIPLQFSSAGVISMR